MTNLLLPAGQVMLDESPAVPSADDATIGALDGAVVLEHRITVGRGPIGDIAVNSAATDSLVVASVGDQSVTIIDPATPLPGVSVPLTGEPLAVIVTADRAYIATGSDSHDTVSGIDLTSGDVVTSIPLTFGVTALAASPDGKRVYAGRTSHGQVDITVIDTASERTGTIDIGYGPAVSLDALCVDPNGKRLYAAVTDASGSRLVIVDSDTLRVQRVVAVGSPIRDIAYAGATVYVLTSDRTVGGAVHVIDLSTNTVTDTVTIGGAPTQLTMSPEHDRAYIVDYDRVAVLCTLSMEVVDSLSFDARPSCVALDSDGAQLYVADYAGTVHTFSVESTIEMLYSQLLATDPIALSVPPALEPVTA
ncbi:MAG: YncE family protein [Mycobacterium sp.]|nr:YncE family protein [Mycobacterium sp.]